MRDIWDELSGPNGFLLVAVIAFVIAAFVCFGGEVEVKIERPPAGQDYDQWDWD